MNKKNMIELLAAIFIAVIFVSSYAAFGGNGGVVAKTSTTTIPGTTQVRGSTRATIVSFGTVIDMNVSCANANATVSSMGGLLNALEKNGSISNFYSPEDSEVLLQLGNYTAAETYNALYAELGNNAACTSFSATQATIQLPATMNAVYAAGSAKIIIPNALRNVTKDITLSKGMSNTVNASVYALVTNNGTVFNGQIIVTLVKA